MRNLRSKVKKNENIIKPEKETVIFRAGGSDSAEDFERQMAQYLKNGGDPDANFIMIIDYF